MVKGIYLKIYLVVLIGITGFTSLRGQDPQFSQFYANPLYLNPAMAGTAYCPRFIANYRNQWPSIPGSFVTYNASYDQYIPKISGGIGVYFMNDVAGKGSLKTNRISLQYAYSLALTRTLSMNFGLEASYFQKSISWDKLSFGDQIDPRRGFVYTSNDVQRGGNVNNVDFSAGVMLYSEIFFVGFSAHHLNQPNESLILGESKLPIKYTVNGGANLNVGDPRRPNSVVISPNILYQRQGDFQQINVGLYA